MYYQFLSHPKEVNYLVLFLQILPGALTPRGETIVRMIGLSLITDYSVLMFFRMVFGLESSLARFSAFSWDYIV
jgi:hypothetical protein